MIDITPEEYEIQENAAKALMSDETMNSIEAGLEDMKEGRVTPYERIKAGMLDYPEVKKEYDKLKEIEDELV